MSNNDYQPDQNKRNTAFGRNEQINRNKNPFTPAKQSKRITNQAQLNQSKSPNGYTPVSPAPQQYENNDENVPPNFVESFDNRYFNNAEPQSQNAFATKKNKIEKKTQFLDKNLSKDRPRSFLPSSMPIDPTQMSNNTIVQRQKEIKQKSNNEQIKRVNFRDQSELSLKKKKSKVNLQSLKRVTRAITMKIKIQSIRDRWLMNIRPYDYEIYVASSFMLIRTKEEIAYIRETGMSKLSIKDANNLLNFLE